jgi:hypothetical protein
MARDDEDGELADRDDEVADDELEEGGRPRGSGIGFVVGFVLGALAGAGAALLLAPQSGDVTRRRIRRGVRRFREGAADRVGEMREGAERELRRARRRVRRHLPD